MKLFKPVLFHVPAANGAHVRRAWIIKIISDPDRSKINKTEIRKNRWRIWHEVLNIEGAEVYTCKMDQDFRTYPGKPVKSYRSFVRLFPDREINNEVFYFMQLWPDLTSTVLRFEQHHIK